jgi:hypothetical protein
MWWLMPASLAIQKAKIKRIIVEGQRWQKVIETQLNQ